MTKTAVAFLVLVATVSLLGAVASDGLAADPPVLHGSINLTNKSWICRGPVDLDSVTVTMNQSFQGPLRGTGNDDAVHLSSGCTGRIGELRVVQYHGDGIKVGGGAHDLFIGGGYVRCFARDPKKHQDGIQAMGGQRVTFYGLTIACLTANNGSFFVNKGSASPEVPTDIVCDHCTLQGGGFTVRISNSLNSGIRNSRVVPGKFGGIHILHGVAENPVDSNNAIVSATSLHNGPPQMLRVGSVAPLRARTLGGDAVVSARVSVDEPVTLRVQAIARLTKAPLPLLRKSQVATAVTGYQKNAIVYAIDTPRTFGLTLRVPARLVKHGRSYVVTVSATDFAGQTGTLRIPFSA